MDAGGKTLISFPFRRKKGIIPTFLYRQKLLFKFPTSSQWLEVETWLDLFNSWKNHSSCIKIRQVAATGLGGRSSRTFCLCLGKMVFLGSGPTYWRCLATFGWLITFLFCRSSSSGDLWRGLGFMGGKIPQSNKGLKDLWIKWPWELKEMRPVSRPLLWVRRGNQGRSGSVHEVAEPFLGAGWQPREWGCPGEPEM